VGLFGTEPVLCVIYVANVLQGVRRDQRREERENGSLTFADDPPSARSGCETTGAVWVALFVMTTGDETAVPETVILGGRMTSVPSGFLICLIV